MPPFWLGVLLMLVFSIHLNILPLSGYSGFASLILPALTLSLPALAQMLRNALIPVTVMFFLSLPWLIGGAVVVENVFAWPGMGQLLWKGIAKQDFVIVQGIVFVITILTVICNIIGDMISGILDPRIRLE